NFKPRFTSTTEFETLMNAAAGRDLGWFYDVYLREAALPELVETRANGQLTLRWKAPRDLPFPLPVDITVNGTPHRLAMENGSATLAVPDDAHVVIDPMARILRHSPAIAAAQRR
ncbi:MAG: peptidase M1, partial [Alphaproteobacteria bacterium HGW-Alphaproteobacteria-15]